MLVLTVISSVELNAGLSDDDQKITVRKVNKQVVLYTIYRGHYEKIDQPIGELITKAIQNEIYPQGSVELAYLNNHKIISKEHWLTEIRVLVGRDALKLAGKMGPMTDVKELPAMEVVVAPKPIGVDDQGEIFQKMHVWIYKNGYMPLDGQCETFFSQPETTDYKQMETEVMIPVKKLPKKN
ncbi:MAG: GyrI-like domain-containing protein [Planctomycetes bacterium]|nr:GyrI-like domain-containing protein [Planctomycetota bacterium]